MDTTQAKERTTQTTKQTRETATEDLDRLGLRDRVERARDLVEDLRDRAEIAFHERPYLLPVATGVLGLGVGILIGSKLSRVMLFTAAGALLSDSIRGQVARISRELVRELGEKGEGGGEEVEDADEMQALPKVTPPQAT